MKKTVKIISTILLIVMLMTMLTAVAYAANNDGPQTVIDELTKPDYKNQGEIQSLGKTIVGIIQIAGVVIAVVVILIIGIKYVIGSAEEKAEYKKTMIPYIVGAILIFAGATIVNVLYSMIIGLNGETTD